MWVLTIRSTSGEALCTVRRKYRAAALLESMTFERLIADGVVTFTVHAEGTV